MVFSTKKRFIAGVVCPKCSAMDKLMAFSLNGEDYRECITCGFKDKLRLVSSPKEMQTRVNMTKDQIKSETSLVRIIEPKE
jgi:uncharacterized metal-binding protein (TIGR02443 family)